MWVIVDCWIFRRRASTPDEFDFDSVNDHERYLREVNRLPPPTGPPVGRIPSPLPEQSSQRKEDINLNYVRVWFFLDGFLDLVVSG